MQKQPRSTHESKRWQDIRARAIDATFDADRRRVGERVAVVFRQGHQVAVSKLELGNELRERMAAFLHDVGHMTLAAEGQTLEAAGHAEAGEMIVAGAKFPLEVVAAVGHHHDRWDAGGKADGLTGESIPLMARILSVAERFEAQTAGHDCQRLTQEEAFAQVVLGSGSEFDPEVVGALGRAVSEKGLELDFPAVALRAPATA